MGGCEEDMKIIQPSVEFYGAVPTDYESALKFIELAGRTCYKSEDKITEGSAEKFVRKLINAKPDPHLAMIEHSNFVVRCNAKHLPVSITEYKTYKYLQVIFVNPYVYIGGNLTAWFQAYMNECPDELFDPFLNEYSKLFLDTEQLITDSKWQVCPHNEIPKELHRYSAKFICDRGVSHELVRHRPCSFAQESTRYVNYFGKEMEFIEPTDFASWTESLQRYFNVACLDAEYYYHELIAGGLTPQQARASLINALKTEIVVTADAAEWQHIRTLRTAPAAHPDMRRVMNMVPWEEIL